MNNIISKTEIGKNKLIKNSGKTKSIKILADMAEIKSRKKLRKKKLSKLLLLSDIKLIKKDLKLLNNV
jgi:hypothetical protein